MPKTAPRDRTNFPKPKAKFTFVTEAYFKENYVQITPYQSLKLRGILPRGIYWLQLAEGGLVQWNLDLVRSYLLEGSTSTPEHQKLLAEYMDTLPQSA